MFQWAVLLGFSIALAGCAAVPKGQTRPQTQVLPRSAPKPPVSRPVDRTQPAAGLEREIAELWRTFPGTTGIAIRQIDSGWMIGQRGDQLFPQQSVSKLWVAMTILEKIDLGRAALTDPVRITSDDLTLFYQPLADSVARNGSVTLTVAELLEKALATSDNTANDSLLRAAGGPAAVNDFIQRKGLGKIRFGPGERLLQSRIAGLEWRQDLSQGRKFYTARANLPLETRQQALSRYLADPIDGASPFAIVTAFDRLARGEILSPASTRLLQDILSRTKSGPNRLKAGVPPGWQFLHKTGTGQDLAGVSTGYNDVGMMTAPDGTRYAIAVMLGDTTAPVPARMQLMQNVARAVANYHQR